MKLGKNQGLYFLVPLNNPIPPFLRMTHIELYILVHGIQITFCIQNTKVHVNIYRVIGHKTIKTKQKTNALLILETQNFKTSTLATSATMPE